MKVKKMTVAFDPRYTDPYVVARIEHTTEYNPGDKLSKKTVDELNASNRWHVVVVAAK